MAINDGKRTVFSISSDGLKNLSLAGSICATLFGVIKFAAGRIEEYDSHTTRIAKLEARESAAYSLADNSKLLQLRVESSKTDIDDIKVKIDTMSNDIVNLRLSDERLRALVERTDDHRATRRSR